MAAGDGLISMTPTSIAHSGTSASINADGGVDFTAVTSLSLNGVFTSDYDNYLVVVTSIGTAAAQSGFMQWRASGSDATGANYTTQRITATGSVYPAARFSSETSARVGDIEDASPGGSEHWQVYGPYLAQPTAYRTVNVSSLFGAVLRDFAGTHSLSTAYDGFTILASGASLSGNVHVFGYEE